MKILVCYDGSKAAIDALKLAQARAVKYDAKIEIVCSVTRHHPLEYSEVEVAEYMLEEEIQNILNEKTVLYETHLLISAKPAAENLIWFAEIKKADEIYIGAKKRTKVAKHLLGSTTQHVILNAPCPVVSVK